VFVTPKGKQVNEAELYAELTQIFREQLRNPTLVIKPDMGPDDVPGWDSGATVAIIMLVEEKFEVEFSAQELKEFRNVDGLMQMLRRHKV